MIQKNHLKKFIVFVIILVIAGILFNSCEQSPRPKYLLKDDEAEIGLKSEFDLIKHPKLAYKCGENKIKKKDIIVFSVYFNCDLGYEDIKNHYDQELTRNGWQFIKEKKVYDWGRDLGGRSIEYKKREFTATIQYAGEEANYGSTYAFSLDWGLGR